MSNLSDFTSSTAGLRNRIINGNCNIAQRGSIAVPDNTGGYGGPDRFFAINNNTAGGQFTQSQASLTFGGSVKNTVRQTVNTAVTSLTTNKYWQGLTQIIEGFNAYSLIGKPITASFIFNSNISGTFCFAARNSDGSRAYLNTFTVTANTPTYISFSMPAVPNTGIPNSSAGGISISIGALNNGDYQGSASAAWQSANVFCTAGATNWGATAGNFIELTELQLEVGSVATPFEQRPYGMELALCERYTLVIPQNMFFGTGTLRTGANNAYIFMSTPVSLRATPAFTYTTITAYSGDSTSVITSIPSINLSGQGLWFGVTFSAATGIVYGSVMLYTTTGSLIISAEL